MSQTNIKTIQDLSVEQAPQALPVTGSDATIDGKKKRALDVAIVKGDLNIEVNESVDLPPDEQNLNAYNKISNVPQNIEVDIISYSVPAGSNLFLQLILASGDNVSSEVRVLVNGSEIDLQRIWWTKFNLTFPFGLGQAGLKIATGGSVVVKAKHNRPMTGSFNARIMGILKTI